MSEKPLVSIIITTCKREMDILERAVKSAVGQTYENKEIIVINDHPLFAENIRELLKKYPDLIFVNNEGPHGVSYVRNIGIEHSKGEYIAFLDDDDEWLSCKVEKQMSVTDGNTGLAYCEISAVRDGKELKTDEDKEYPEGMVFEQLLGDNFIGGCSAVLFSKSAALEAGGFDTALSFGEDYDLWLAIAKKYRVSAIKEKLVIYRIGHESLTGDFNKRVKGWEHILEKYADDYNKYPAAYREFTSVIVREAAKRMTMGYAFDMFRKYGNFGAFLKGSAMKILKIY
ncbi:MAG: glycosyltransferase family 2 protein [Lachnospiraceae bacterium]|nr:glycosyltransferase family 2 protein [Lachnospiraceae bacterium]